MRLGVWSCVLWYLSRDMSVWYQCFFNCDWHSKLLISGSLPGIVGMGLAHLPLRWNDAPSRISHVTWCGDPAWKGFGHAWGLGVSGTINVVMLPKTFWLSFVLCHHGILGNYWPSLHLVPCISGGAHCPSWRWKHWRTSGGLQEDHKAKGLTLICFYVCLIACQDFCCCLDIYLVYLPGVIGKLNIFTCTPVNSDQGRAYCL